MFWQHLTLSQYFACKIVLCCMHVILKRPKYKVVCVFELIGSWVWTWSPGENSAWWTLMTSASLSYTDWYSPLLEIALPRQRHPLLPQGIIMRSLNIM